MTTVTLFSIACILITVFTGLPRDVVSSSPLLCQTFVGYRDLKEAHQALHCKANEVCYRQKISFDGGIYFYGGCAPQAECSSTGVFSPEIPVHAGEVVCSQCCQRSHCNRYGQLSDCNTTSIPKTATSTVATITTEPTTTIFTTKTTSTATIPSTTTSTTTSTTIPLTATSTTTSTTISTTTTSTTTTTTIPTTNTFTATTTTIPKTTTSTSTATLTTTTTISPTTITSTSSTSSSTSSIATTTTVPTGTTAATAPKPTTMLTTQQAINGLQCAVCEGGICGLIPGMDPIQQCPDETPYCLNTVDNDQMGNKKVTKSCSSLYDCETKWWRESSDLSYCAKFNPAGVYTFTFSCSYCCIKDKCNMDIFPKSETLFVGNAK